MPVAARIIILISGIVLFLIVFEMVRKGKFREELSVVWLLFSVVVGLGAFVDLIIDPLAKMLNIYYPPTLAFVIVFVFLVLALFYFSMVISELKGKVKELSQKIALLEYELKRSCGDK